MGNLFRSTILILFLVIAGAAKAQNSCVSLFAPQSQSTHIKSNKALVSYLSVIEAFRDNRTSFPLQGKISETLNWMESELNLVKSKDPRVVSEVSRLQKDIRTVSTGREIPYLEFAFLAQRFSAGITFKFADKIVNYDEVLALLRGDGKGPLTEGIQSSKFFFLPTTLSLGVESMNTFHAEGVAVLGLTSKIELVDGRSYLPWEFFRHDVDHALYYERQPFTLEKSDLYPQLSFAERNVYFYRFKEHVERISKNDYQRKLYHTLWFVVFHETGLPIHKENLTGQLNLLKGTSYANNRIETLLLRLNDMNDLGYSFKGKKLTPEDVERAMDDLLEFTRN